MYVYHELPGEFGIIRRFLTTSTPKLTGNDFLTTITSKHMISASPIPRINPPTERTAGKTLSVMYHGAAFLFYAHPVRKAGIKPHSHSGQPLRRNMPAPDIISATSTRQLLAHWHTCTYITLKRAPISPPLQPKPRSHAT